MKHTIVGAGKSGIHAAILAQDLGYGVFLTESKTEAEASEAAKTLAARGIEAEFGGHTDKALDADLIVASPGIPPTNPFLQEAERRKIPIISEVEFAWRHLDSARNPVVAITGTNGKTTTTALTAHIFNQSGRKAVACGNIGAAVSSVVRELEEGTIVVIETSSYQLDRIVDFRPDVAAILNITPDHLSYHGTFERYCEAKYKISLNQNSKNVLILNADDEPSKAASAHTSAQILHFGAQPLQQGLYASAGKILIPPQVFPALTNADAQQRRQHKEELLLMVDEIRIPGIHNVYNSMAAALAARAFEIRNENIRDSLMSFAGVEHRLEYVRTLNGVDYINDSKATNVNSTWYALSSYTKPLTWIAGGRGDNNDYSSLDEIVAKNVRNLVCIGEEADALFNHFSAKVRCLKASSLEEAVARAAEISEPGSITLFSPACKSFDMFANYEHRGLVFKEAVEAL